MSKQLTIAQQENRADYQVALAEFMEDLEQIKAFAEIRLEEEYEQAESEDVLTMQIRAQKMKNITDELLKRGDYA